MGGILVSLVALMATDRALDDGLGSDQLKFGCFENRHSLTMRLLSLPVNPSSKKYIAASSFSCHNFRSSEICVALMIGHGRSY
jgi:hypothetical protein